MIDQASYLLFFYVLVRVSVMLAVSPFFGEIHWPAPAKILFSFAVCLAIFPHLTHAGWINIQHTEVMSQTLSGLLGVVFVEAIFGLCMGYFAKLTFQTIQVSGELSGTFMGLTSASLFNPSLDSQSNVIEQFQYALAMILFLALDGHHVILRAITESFRFVEIGAFSVHGGMMEFLIRASGSVLVFGIIMATPLAISLFAVNMVFGVMAKAMPQMNVLVLSFGASALVGLFVMGLSLSEYHGALTLLFDQMASRLEEFLRIAGSR